MDYVGLKISESLPLLVNKLVIAGLYGRIRVIVSGKMISPADVAWAIAVGAHFVVSARGFMFSLGCIQAMQCNKNTCPTGVTTDNKRLQAGLHPESKAVRVANYHKYLEYGVNIIAHSCGVTDPRQLTRKHARVIKPDGESMSLLERYPWPDTAKAKSTRKAEKVKKKPNKGSNTSGGYDAEKSTASAPIMASASAGSRHRVAVRLVGRLTFRRGMDTSNGSLGSLVVDNRMHSAAGNLAITLCATAAGRCAKHAGRQRCAGEPHYCIVYGRLYAG